MNENIESKKRGLPFVGLSASIILLLYAFLSAFARSWGCGGTDAFACSLLSRLDLISMTVNWIFLPIALIHCVIGQTRFFKVSLALYTIVVLSVFSLLAIVYDGTALNSLRGKEIECKLSTGSYQEECYSKFAQATGDLAMCEKVVPYSHYRGECQQHFALKSGDASVCGASNAFCVKAVALQEGDDKICDAYLTLSDKDECNVSIAEKTNNPLICEKISSSMYSYCREVGEKIEADPAAYMSAKNIEFEIKMLSSVLRAGDRDVSIMQIVASVPEGVASVNEFFLMMDGGSVFEVFPNLRVQMLDDNGSSNRITTSGVFARLDERPSYGSLFSRPIIISAGKPKTFIIKADVKPYFKGTMSLMDVTVKTVGETQKTLKKLEGDRNIVIQ